MLDPMIRLAALCCVLFIAPVRGAEAENAQTAGEISNKRNQACKDLKGDAREQCLNSYVGPEEGSRYGRDSVYTSKHGGARPKPFKSHGEWTKPGRS